MEQKSLNKIKICAFTLAEVLITLGIIGVVAALTIPALIQNSQNQALKSQFKKQASVVEAAFKQAALDNGGSLAGYSAITTNNFNISDDLVNIVKPYLRYIKICYRGQQASCQPLTTSYTTYSGGVYSTTAGGREPTSNNAVIVLNDGTILYFWTYWANFATCSGGGITNTQDSCGILAIDVNGVKGPNQAGKDLFEFQISSAGRLVPAGTINDSVKDTYSKNLGFTDHIMDMLN